MVCYTINSMIFSNADDLLSDINFKYEGLEKAVPYLTDVLAYLIINQDPDSEIHWFDEGSRDYFSFDCGVDFIEILQSLELLLTLGEGIAHDQFFSHRHSDLIISFIMKNVQNTYQSITIADLKQRNEAELLYENIYPQIIAINEWIS